MVRNAMTSGLPRHEIAFSATVVAILAAREITARRGREVAAALVAVSVTLGTGGAKGAISRSRPQDPPVAGKKRRRRPPLRMTPKAQRRRWFRHHNRRMRALAVSKARADGEQLARDENPADLSDR